MVSGNTTPFALLIILGIESIVAFLGNGFIIAVNGQRWLQSRKMLPSDLLLTTLSTTRFLWQLVAMTVQLLYFCSSEYVCGNYLWESSFYLWKYFSSASIWCATWLSVFYCVKITNFAHCFFLWLKPRIDVLVPKLLRLSLSVFSIPSVLNSINMKIYCILSKNITENTNQPKDSNNYQHWIFISIELTFTAINISLCLMASILLFISLWRHTRNLKRSGIVSKDLSTQAHINVINSLLSFLIFYILYMVVVTISLSYFLKFKAVERLITNVVLALSASAHPIILILSNPKRKNVCVQILKIKQTS